MCGDPWAFGAASLAKYVISRASDRPCLEKQGRAHERKILSVDLWFPYTRACTPTYVCVSLYYIQTCKLLHGKDSLVSTGKNVRVNLEVALIVFIGQFLKL